MFVSSSRLSLAAIAGGLMLVAGISSAAELPRAALADEAGPPKLKAGGKAAKGEVVGKLTDAGTGAPVAGAEVVCGAVINETGGGGGRATTDKDGVYHIKDLSPGIYIVWLAKPLADPKLTAAADDGIRVEAGKTAKSSLRVITGRRVAGVLLNEADMPLAGHQVICYSTAQPASRGNAHSQKTKPDGSFEWYLPPGYVHVNASAGVGVEGERLADHANFDVSADIDPPALRLRLHIEKLEFGSPDWLRRSTRGTTILRRDRTATGVRGTVVDVAGKSIAGAQVFKYEPPIYTTDEKGEFHLPTGRAEQFVMYAFADGYRVWFGTPTSGDVLKIVLEAKVAADVKKPDAKKPDDKDKDAKKLDGKKPDAKQPDEALKLDPAVEKLVSAVEAAQAKLRSLSVTTDYVKLDHYLVKTLEPARMTVTVKCVADGEGRFAAETDGQLINLKVDGYTLYDEQTKCTYDGETFRQMRGARGDLTSASIDKHWSLHGLHPLEFISRFQQQPITKLLRERGATLVKEVEHDGRKVQVVESTPVKFDGGQGKYQFWIDAERGAIVRRAVLRKPDSGEWYEYARIAGEGFREIAAGIWLPDRVHYESVSRLADGGEKLDWSYFGVNQDWKVNFDLPKDAFRLKFHDGLPVQDRTKTP